MDKDGYVTGTELGMYLHKRVPHYDWGQAPQYGKMKDPFYLVPLTGWRSPKDL